MICVYIFPSMYIFMPEALSLNTVDYQPWSGKWEFKAQQLVSNKVNLHNCAV